MGSPNFDNSYARLPGAFHARLDGTSAPEPALLRLNDALALRLGLDPEWLASEAGVRMLSGGPMPPQAAPLAMVYAGHQFGGWSPRLGDGRALLVGEVVDADGVRHDIHLKGSGCTPYSRGGDGKATLGSVLREHMLSEGMAALGVPTTRTLATLTTGEQIDRGSAQAGAVLARVARSHVRVGTFQYFYARDETEHVRLLADYVIERHYPGAREEENAYRGLFERVAQRQAALVAQWMSLGFIHGVMNTDNVQIAGETLDYGPCAFMDVFHPAQVFSSIDHGGRYAWGNQAGISHWNLARFAETLLPLIDPEQERAIAWVEGALGRFGEAFRGSFDRRMWAKLGFEGAPADDELMSSWLALMAKNRVDFTLSFRHLTRLAAGDSGDGLRALFERPEDCDTWLERWRTASAESTDLAARLERMRGANPIFIPRNHRVEQAIEAAEGGDLGPFHRLVDVLAKPFDEQPQHAELERAPAPDEVVERTFCGT